MAFLIELLEAVVISVIAAKWPGLWAVLMNMAIGILAAWMTATVAVSFTHDSTIVRLIASATFLAYLASAFLWVRLRAVRRRS